VFITRKDFSFLGPIIAIAGIIALGVIICAVFFGGFTLGLWFSIAMIVLAAAAILYDTSNILHHYRMDQHVAAALNLFASVAMLFYYVLLALMQSRDR
jgi:FtsH-binding integral membrane protein